MLEVELGLCEDYPEESRSLAAARLDLERTRATGATVLRIAFGWDAIEPERGRFDWGFWDDFVRLAVEEYDLRLIPYVCYTPAWAASEAGDDSWRSPPRDMADFEHFLATISARYAPWIDSWEIWNEPDNPAYWTGDVESFAELLRAGSRGARRGNPAATIVLGGLAWDLDFLRSLLAEQDAARHVDVVNVHSYFETWHEDPIESLPAYLEEAATIIREQGEGEPLWMAEVGYSSRGNSAQVSEVYRARFTSEHTPEAQASALARTMLVSLATGRLALFAWYRINDLPTTQDVIGDDNNLHLGLFDGAGNPKPARRTFAWLTRLLRQPHRVMTDQLHVQSEEPVEARAFALADGRTLVGVWFAPVQNAPPAEPVEDRRRGRVHLVVNAAASAVAEVHYTSNRGGKGHVMAQPHPRGLQLEVPLAGSEVAMVLLGR